MLDHPSVEPAKVLTIERAAGPVLISADVHGNLRDFERLRDLFLASEARGEAPLWVSVGDWVHGPALGQRRDVTDRYGAPLYDYPDQTPELLRGLFDLMDRYPDRVVSLCGNHEHAHIGGRRTRKFHQDEAAHLESQLSATDVSELRRRFASWPILVRLAPCGVVITHGAPYAAPAQAFERVRFVGGDSPSCELRNSAMSRYGFDPGEDVELLAQLSDQHTYSLLLHGHDREEEGFAAAGAASLLLCTSFGARQDRKTYGWLDAARRYHSLADLEGSGALRRLWPEAGATR
jgi:hypothetical protein